MPAVSTQLNAFVAAATMPPRYATGPGLLARLSKVLHDARLRAQDREIGFLIERCGGRITDDLERQIERRLL